jgi:hypothetical protein
VSKIIPAVLLEGATATGPGTATDGSSPGGSKTFQAVLTGTGALTATVLIQGSNDNSHWTTVATISLDGSDDVSDSAETTKSFVYWRANIGAIAGTSASVDVITGMVIG